MTEFELLIDFYKDGKRQGPGSTSETLKALNFIDFDKDKLEQAEPLKIADIGCGSGAQTMVLAQNTDAEITAVDLFPEILTKLNRRAEQKGLKDKIKTLAESMDALPFAEEEFDIIWSEGAVYIMGFEEGIKYWQKFLKSGGYLVLSEITWLTNTRPKEIEEYWNSEYPEINTASAKIKVLEENNFSPVGYFVLSEEAWLDNFYKPLEARFDDFLKKHDHSQAAEEFIKAVKAEIEMYKKYKEYLSYGFYIAKRL